MTGSRATHWLITLTAAGALMITMGMRQSTGLFISPLNTATGVGVAAISLSIAIGHLVWGLIQPLAGAIADRYGPGRVIAVGALVLASGYAITPFMTSSIGLTITIGILMAAGAGMGSFSVLIGAASRHLAADKRGMASGVINAGASVGQMVFAPITQKLITVVGWVNAMWALALVSLLTLPLARVLRGKAKAASAASGVPFSNTNDIGLRAAVTDALNNRSFLLLNAGFFTCGFHIAFLVTHLPGEVALCGLSPIVASWSLAIIGLANIVGSLAVGWGVGHYRSKMMLFWMYASRVLLIAVYLAAPKTELTLYLFAAGLGLTWLATVPPTAALVGKLFGTRYLSTLFGLTLLSHQIGGFLGAWLGGIAVVEWGSYQSMWVADMLLAAVAAVANLPIRESHPNQRASG
ncbi:MAG: MFS transporter [Aeromicrobium sp.]|nr:MFS transporter [Burkholderiales bacterium]